MDEGSPDRRVDSLAQIGRALDALRELVRQLEGKAAGDLAPPPSASRFPATDVAESGDHLAALSPFHEVLSVPLHGPDAGEILGAVVDRLMQQAFVDRIALFLLDPARGRLLPRVGRGFRRGDLTTCALVPGEGLVGRAFLERRPFFYRAPSEEFPADEFLLRFPVGDAVAVPVQVDGETAGVLFVARRGRPAPFTTGELQLIAVVADRAGVTLARERLVDRLRESTYRTTELVDLLARASVRYDLRKVLSKACETGARLLKTAVTAIAVRADGDGLEVRASYGFSEEAMAQWRPDAGAGVTAEVFRVKQPIVRADLHADHEEPALRALGIRALLVVPLRVREEVVGSLYLADPRPRQFSDGEVESAKLLAAIAGLAMENERLYREVRQAFSRVATAQDWLIQTEKARALEAMAGGLAHEFNNVLAIIIGKMQFVQEGISDARLRADMKVVEDAAWRAAEIVRRLQRFAATRSTEDPVRLDLSKVVEEAVALTRARWKDEAEAHGLKIEVAMSLAERAPVFGSPAELREMLLNLIVNALDAMPHGGCLSLATRERGDRVELSVGDTGVGMNETVRRRLFDPFFTTRSPERSGLGLSVVRGIVTRHRGTIDVESREGGGTTFLISFPAARSAGPRPASLATSEVEPFQAPARILLIEDEEQILRTLEDVLGSAGHAVDSAKNGLEALDLFQRGRYNVVITDLSIPERSGLEVAEAVKHLAPGTPVILMTGWTDLLDPVRVRDSGVDLTIPKPFLPGQILTVVVDALKLRPPAP